MMRTKYFSRGLGLFLGLSLGLWACGGGDTPDPKAGQAQSKKAPDPDEAAEAKRKADMEKAAKAYETLSERLEKLPDDKPVDPKWLKGEYAKILKLDPKHVGARFSMAALREAEGDKAFAMKEYEDIADQHPEFAPASENLAAELVAKGELDDAREIYEDFAKRDPKNITSRLGLARLHLREKQYEPAIELCRKVLQRQGNAIEAFRILATAYKATGNTPMAELVIGRGLKVEKEDPELHYLLAQLLLDRDELTAGLDKLKQVIRMKPDWLKVRAQFAGIALSYRDFGNASQQYTAILKQAKDNREAQIGLAVSYKGMGRFEQAEKIYKELLAKNKDDADALWNMATLYHRHLNRYDEAIASYKRYGEVVDEKDEKAKQLAGLIKEVQATKSDLAAQKARQEREAKKLAAIKAACEAVAQGKPATKLAEAIGNEQERIEVAWQLMGDGQMALEAGQMPAGEAAVQCALGIIPDSPNAKTSACAPMRVMWTQLLYQLGRMQDAVASIDQALVCDPENPDAQLIKQQLTELIAQAEAERAAQEAAAAEAAAQEAAAQKAAQEAAGQGAGQPGAGGAAPEPKTPEPAPNAPPKGP